MAKKSKKRSNAIDVACQSFHVGARREAFQGPTGDGCVVPFPGHRHGDGRAERFLVKGLEHDAIAAVDVESLGAVTLENDRLTVDETGYYYFGIHDISAAGGYSLYVDNFVVEEGAADNAPAAITDLQVVQDAHAGLIA